MSDENSNVMEEQLQNNETNKKHFYTSAWWIFIWSLFIWPIGILMLWKFLDDKKENEMPRTKLIKEEFENF